jgi:hypothetical protein
MTHERKITRNSVSGVAIADKLEIYGIAVEDVCEKRSPGVDGYDCEDADNVLLLVRAQVVQSVLHDVPDG